MRVGARISVTSKPQGRMRKGVVDIAPDALAERLVEHPSHRLVLLGIRQYGTVSFGKLHLARVGRVAGYAFEPRSRHPLDLAGEDVFTLLRPADPVDVDRVHAGEPVEAGRVERRDPRYRGGSCHPPG